ncbi:hypothetical protein [Acidaminobacter sp. JC074]|uniref:hypothetical protein n=1 Tax=Acidaminobacter sp. JC074 TaxID=2530199 RepID=UPI001F1055FE|nr:hypothetical protein [Acidaminobacter sp. JC074]
MLKNDKGVALVEYVFLISLVIIGVIGALALFGDELLNFYQNIIDSITELL